MSNAPEITVPDAHDIRPIVATGNASNWGLWAFVAVLIIGGVSLFSALSASRQASNAPSTLVPQSGEGARIASPAPLALPPRFLEPALEPDQGLRERPLPPARIAAPSSNYAPTLVQPAPIYAPLPVEPTIAPTPQSRIVFEADNSSAAAVPNAGSASESERVTAERFANPSLTIPLGTVIPAVLETALDSTRAGAVRALIQRDIYGFDGTRVLLPRGTRLYGEYEADLQAGQKRANITWTRLLRPDGVTMALNSPASDPLGRAGVKGKVDSKFFQRFGGAILQSILDIGVGVATREVSSDGVIVALPGSTQNLQVQQPQDVLPTLKIKHGTSVSVFVAQDLDFSTVEF
jgi:type IV secretion system protein VirB10